MGRAGSERSGARSKSMARPGAAGTSQGWPRCMGTGFSFLLSCPCSSLWHAALGTPGMVCRPSLPKVPSPGSCFLQPLPPQSLQPRRKLTAAWIHPRGCGFLPRSCLLPVPNSGGNGGGKGGVLDHELSGRRNEMDGMGWDEELRCKTESISCFLLSLMLPCIWEEIEGPRCSHSHCLSHRYLPAHPASLDLNPSHLLCRPPAGAQLPPRTPVRRSAEVGGYTTPHPPEVSGVGEKKKKRGKK